MSNALRLPWQTLPALWFLGLGLLWAGLLFGGWLLGTPDAARTRRMPAWTRLGSSGVLVMAAWSWVPLATWSGADTALAVGVALGMTLGFVGDLALAGLLRLKQRTLGGMAAFGLGHVAYITTYWRFGSANGLDAPWLREVALAAWLLIGLVGWFVVVLRGRRASGLCLAALPYALLLASTAGVGTGLALQVPAFVPLALGGALFLASDLLLATRLFNQAHFPWLDDLVWLTYGPAQALIVASVGVALAGVGG